MRIPAEPDWIAVDWGGGSLHAGTVEADGVTAIHAVLPEATELYAVGGAGPGNMAAWRKAGITGFGIGSALYRPGDSAAAVAEKAKAIVSAYDAEMG